MKCLYPFRKPDFSAAFLAKVLRRINTTSVLVLALLIAVPSIVFVVKVSGQSGGSALLISQFRVRGPNGANDEFIEIYNNSN